MLPDAPDNASDVQEEQTSTVGTEATVSPAHVSDDGADIPPDLGPAVEDWDNDAAAEVEADVETAADKEVQERSERPAFEPVLNVTLRYPTSTPFKSTTIPPLEESLALTTATTDEIEKMGQDTPLSNLGNSEKTVIWARAIADSARHVWSGDALRPAAERPEAHWQQGIQSESYFLEAGRPKLSEDSTGEKLTGLAAKIKMQSVLGAGSPIRVPLWHTGIWLVLDTPSAAELLSLDRRIGMEKILLGRMTNGMIFSNSSVYVTAMLVDFVLRHVRDATVRFADPEDLKKIIKSTDIPAMIWGSMISVYPGGYPYEQPCMQAPGKCNHVVKELLNLSKLQWTDDRALTDWQRKHMQKRNSKSTQLDLDRYEEEHRYHHHATLKLNPKLSMDLRVPTISEYLEIGTNWVDDVVRTADRSIVGAVKDDERNEIILSQAQISYLHQYSHWVKRLTLNTENGTKVIEERDDISSSIDVLVGRERESLAFIDGVGKFISECTISFIAIPKIDCVNCGKPMTPEAKIHPALAPFDVMSSFFTVQSQHTSKVLNRSTM